MVWRRAKIGAGIAGRNGTMKHLAAAFLVGLALAAPAMAKKPQASVAKDYGAAPAGCYYGPRGGLHCPRVVRGPSEETTTQRDKRLMRECRGRPNAGACLGYAR